MNYASNLLVASESYVLALEDKTISWRKDQRKIMYFSSSQCEQQIFNTFQTQPG